MQTHLSKYSDPPNVDNLLSSLKSLSSEDEILSSIRSLYPDWIKNIYSSYSSDYPHLTENWGKLCLHLGVSPKKIVTTEVLALELIIYIAENKLTQTVKLLTEASEILTQKGYCIRRESEFGGCIFCHKAIPSEKVHAHLKNACKFSIPIKWSPACSECLR